LQYKIKIAYSTPFPEKTTTLTSGDVFVKSLPICKFFTIAKENLNFHQSYGRTKRLSVS